MGFRLSIKNKGSDKSYGDDHKLYGYFDYFHVKKSFDVLVPFMHNQWDTLLNPMELDEEKDFWYDLMTFTSSTDDLVIDYDTFVKWTELYLDDLWKNKQNKELVENVRNYFNILKESKEDKVLYWG